MSKVTLKVGDTMCAEIDKSIDGYYKIDGFEYGVVIISEGGYIYPFKHQYYYINDVKYAKENIIVPPQVAFKDGEIG